MVHDTLGRHPHLLNLLLRQRAPLAQRQLFILAPQSPDEIVAAVSRDEHVSPNAKGDSS